MKCKILRFKLMKDNNTYLVKLRDLDNSKLFLVRLKIKDLIKYTKTDDTSLWHQMDINYIPVLFHIKDDNPLFDDIDDIVVDANKVIYSNEDGFKEANETIDDLDLDRY